MKHSIFPSFALKKLGTFVAIIVIFIHNVVLDRDLKCNCEAPGRGCDSFMAMPFFIIFFVHLWTDKTFLRTWIYACDCTCKCSWTCICTCVSSVWALLCHIVKAGFIGSIWVISVLIDGDWWVCCKSDKKLACKTPTNLTAQDHTTIAELKIESLIAGMSILLAILLVAFMSSFVPKNCCEESRRCNMKIKYYSAFLDEEENVLKEILTKSAKDQLTGVIKERIHNNTWDKCYDFAKDVIKESPEPRLSQQQQEDLTNMNKKENTPSNNNSNSNGRDGVRENDPEHARGQPGENLPLMERGEAAGNQKICPSICPHTRLSVHPVTLYLFLLNVLGALTP